MKYILDKEELENIKTKLLSNVTDFLVELAKISKTEFDISSPMRLPFNKTLYIDISTYKESVDNLRDKLAETINNI